jgi:hypothetical protein
MKIIGRNVVIRLTVIYNYIMYGWTLFRYFRGNEISHEIYPHLIQLHEWDVKPLLCNY